MKKFSWLFSFVLALTFSALVIGGGRKPAPKPKPKPKPPVVSNIKELKLLSYNLGLAHGYVPYAEARLPKLTAELKKSDADILCFQEVWKAEDRTKIINSLKSKYPYSVSAPTKQHHRKTGWFSGPACRVRDLFGAGKFISIMSFSLIFLEDSRIKQLFNLTYPSLIKFWILVLLNLLNCCCKNLSIR